MLNSTGTRNVLSPNGGGGDTSKLESSPPFPIRESDDSENVRHTSRGFPRARLKAGLPPMRLPSEYRESMRLETRAATVYDI